MSYSAAATPRSCLPRSFAGKNDLPIELHRLANDAGQRLIDMYLAFQPRNSFQGLPPIKDEVCVRWVREMLATGIHLVATEIRNADETPSVRDGELPLIGHAALFPVNDKKCELLVVVCPGFQNLGIGTELVRSCIELADELGFERIWLPVDATNVRARHVYRKCGFEYVSSELGRELDMNCDVRSRRPKMIHDLHGPESRVPVPRLRFPALLPLVEEK
jgi:RimJ/RimL family protein N-acetyltransferase